MMKKRLSALLALLLCLLTLCSCSRAPALPVSAAGTPAPAATPAPTPELVPFSRMVYERPEYEELQRAVARTADALSGGCTLEEAIALLDDCFARYDRFDTMYTLADIRSCQNLSDEFYAAEYQWCLEKYALVEQDFDRLYYACASSPLAASLEDEYFWPGFTEQYSDESESIYSDETVALMQEESALIAEYRALSADPVVRYEGREVPFDELLETLSGSAYNEAVIAYYTQYNEAFADLFIRLVSVRERLAAAAGYANFEEMQYDHGYARDYTPAQAEAYLKDIAYHLVPLYFRLTFRGGPVLSLRDRISEDELRSLIGGAAADFGGTVSEAFDFMLRYELCDLRVDSRKASMSFETYLRDYNAPFLFLNASGYTDDILSTAHEFGHFCDAYANEGSFESVDLAEVYSQAMEYLTLARLESLMEKEKLNKLTRMALTDVAEMYVQQASFAAFEHRVYELGSENLSAEVLNDLARQAARDYGFYDADYDAFYSMSWFDVPHYFEQPFYIVSYPISNDLAMQIYELERNEPGAGRDCYLNNLERDFSGLLGLAEAGGLESPFAEGRVEKIAAMLGELLGL